MTSSQQHIISHFSSFFLFFFLLNCSSFFILHSSSFHCMPEFEQGTKGHEDGSVSWGLENMDDMDFKSWVAMVIGPSGVLIIHYIWTWDFNTTSFLFFLFFLLFRTQTAHDGRIYSVRIVTGPDYPKVPPKLQFRTKINMGCVDARGNVFLSYHFLFLHNLFFFRSQMHLDILQTGPQPHAALLTCSTL